MKCRLIVEDSVGAARGLAADQTLAHRAAAGDSPPTLRLYTYRSHCALTGRFQAVENEIHVGYCRDHGIEINRRPTGGGAILMGADQLGVALAWPCGQSVAYSEARVWMRHFSEGLGRSLAVLGVNAAFEGKNDLRVDGRKIAGLGVYCTPGGLLFHASLLVDLDVELMLRVLKTPFEKIREREIASVSARMTTLRRETGSAIPMRDVMRQVAAGYAAALGVDLVYGNYSMEELKDVAALEASQYSTGAWIFQPGRLPGGASVRRTRSDAGTLEIAVSVAGKVFQSVYIRGDFFAAESALADLESELRWHSIEHPALTATLERFCSARPGVLGSLAPQNLAAAIHSAARRAERMNTGGAPQQPYGCFVRPGEGR
jgi:lipoate-protein ligase A